MHLLGVESPGFCIGIFPAVFAAFSLRAGEPSLASVLGLLFSLSAEFGEVLFFILLLLGHGLGFESTLEVYTFFAPRRETILRIGGG